MLVDAYGRPFSMRALAREHVDEESPWATPMRDSVAYGLTPERAGRLLRSADEGDVLAYLTLAEELEERDLHYRSVLFTRKVRVSGIVPAVEAVDDSDEEQRIAEDVRELVWSHAFRRLVFDMLDGLGKGYSIVEILWDSSESQWWPRAFRWRDPRWYSWDPKTLRTLRLEDGTPGGRPLPPGKYLVHRPALKSGVPLRAGLARPALIAYVFKNFSVRDLARFLEVYGIPPRIGRHDPNAPDEDKRKLLAAARMLGTDAAAIVPNNMQLELLETKSNTSSGTTAFLGPIEWWDRQVSKVVLGQTSSSEGSGGDYKASSQHQSVRLDIAAHDAAGVEETVVRDLIKVYVDLNYGPRRRYTSVTLAVPAAEDLTRFATAITQLVDRGLEVDQEQIRERLGLSEPEPGKALLRPAGKQTTLDEPTEPADEPSEDDPTDPTEEP